MHRLSAPSEHHRFSFKVDPVSFVLNMTGFLTTRSACEQPRSACEQPRSGGRNEPMGDQLLNASCKHAGAEGTFKAVFQLLTLGVIVVSLCDYPIISLLFLFLSDILA